MTLKYFTFAGFAKSHHQVDALELFPGPWEGQRWWGWGGSGTVISIVFLVLLPLSLHTAQLTTRKGGPLPSQLCPSPASTPQSRSAVSQGTDFGACFLLKAPHHSNPPHLAHPLPIKVLSMIPPLTELPLRACAIGWLLQ